MKLMNAMTHFTRQLAANGCSVHTQKAYARDLAAFARWLGENLQLSAIKPDDLACFLTSDAVLRTPDGSPRKPITINRTKSALRSFFAFETAADPGCRTTVGSNIPCRRLALEGRSLELGPQAAPKAETRGA